MKRYWATVPSPGSSNNNASNIVSQSSSSIPKQVDLDELPSDPAKRRKISEYHPNQRDEIRRKYLIKGPCQPRGHDFPQKEIGKTLRRFNSKWFDQYPNWLEYSIQDDTAFCLPCYLFKDHFENRAGNDAFVTEGFSSWKVLEFCEKHEISMLNMDEDFVNPRRPRQRTNITNRHHYEYECFNSIMDLQINEFDDRFNEVNSELLLCMASLSPIDSFREFDASKLLRLAEFYPSDFSCVEHRILEHQVSIYIDNVLADERFARLKSLSDLARVMVDTRKHLSHPLVYKLLKLALTLPVATATVERCFSAMKIVKTNLRNRIGDKYLSDCLICFIERDVFETVTNETVMDLFQKMKTRREQL
ncbi:unnamed protein product [Cuscuta epithymum]|uniref:TTF-type domain-containing protein n=1 Tax=Cuscuta epithymum TaxID=186058 RepID=A0AAV0DIC0_9ASTE|nr:unnamed protein product [Cuscuta epithymum]